METFSQECGEDEIIGVHCTHGVNRAGYLICRYLVQQLGWKHADALKGFADARGYPIERTTYINDLKRAAVGAKVDVSKVNLDSPVKPVGKTRPNMKHLGHRPHGHFPPGPPGGMPPRRGFMNGGPFPPPPHAGKFGPPRGPAFGPPRPPPPMPGPPPLPPRGPAMFGPPRPPPRGPYGPPPPPMPGSMRHGPPLPPPPPPGPPGMRLPPGPPRPGPPVMGPPVPPPRIPGVPSRNVPPRPGPPPPVPPVPRLPPAKVAPPKAAMTRAGARLTNKRPLINKDPDFTSDDFVENLAARPSKQPRKRPFPKN